MFLTGVYILLFAYKEDWLAWVFGFGFSIVGTVFGYSLFDKEDTNKSALELLKETLEATDVNN